MKKKIIKFGPLIIICISIFAIVVGFVSIHSSQEDKKRRNSCIESGKVYDEKTKNCREKTVSEKFDEKCQIFTPIIHIGKHTYNCSQIKEQGLEKAYLDNNIVEHGNKIYKGGTSSEINAGKQAGDYCLSASDTWSHIGETRCVVFTPTYLAHQGNNYFLDEKKDYKNGFVVYMYGNYGWNWFLDTYKDKGPVLVCGTISLYDGHPQIKTSPSGITLSPKETKRGSYTVYAYSCH